ncbi:MAG TPA: tRNA preQ1(34) S-adenosylmethionine ribosyltransferase-isomerase QueA [Deltaproteobacteria bacterium]|nr:tRNA preQ1(34) S-adenosylmethionine ribosyltransferase-isomerase QueA [Deltaproteobacteria bacterium]HQI01419.1 tRNA preQ1(34) S-adenosylmethionine ribosyltransferase-isomerase QueA [Deltaproteobacteria bacterium]HQJ09085.1 tRNA preQ1(34) S-adenosylmethionine ribosyltransferase-isomerase QueA [Deltaproteobacteria bacterium]
MDISRFDYPLPKELIAQYPMERGHERLLVLERETGRSIHRHFEDIEEYLSQGDLLVLNDTRVMHARLFGRKESGGRIEVLLVKETDRGTWLCLLKASKSPKPGTALLLENSLQARVESRQDDLYEIAFSDPERVLLCGRIPLPPYIERSPEEIDESMYQTVYARHEGSVAAPTAGLHFTPEFLERLRSKGVETAFVTLHVGPGTFVPVKTENIEDHRMHPEDFSVTEEAALIINRAMEEGRRIVAVGTTTTRVLEHLMVRYGRIVPGAGSTNLFIFEGFRFRIVGALLTNFHLPCSTLLMLVSAFGGYEYVMEAYRAALKERYRFFSYGDAMFIF